MSLRSAEAASREYIPPDDFSGLTGDLDVPASFAVKLLSTAEH